MSQEFVSRRVKLIIQSCKTREQLKSAERYLRQYMQHYDKDEHHEDLQETFRKKDKELFPDF